MSIYEDKSLVRDSDGANAQEITDLLSKYGVIVKGASGRDYTTIFKDDFSELDTDEKIAIALLFESIKSEISTNSPFLSPGEISRRADLSMNEAYPALRRLERKGVVVNQGGTYHAPAHKIPLLKRLLRD